MIRVIIILDCKIKIHSTYDKRSQAKNVSHPFLMNVNSFAI